MMHRLDVVRVTALTLLAAALLGVAIPVCAMPECSAAPTAACSGTTPACPDCDSGNPVVMKHLSDEGVAPTPLSVDAPVALSPVLAAPKPALVAFTVPEPDATGAPPPLDPLGVRLIV